MLQRKVGETGAAAESLALSAQTPWARVADLDWPFGAEETERVEEVEGVVSLGILLGRVCAAERPLLAVESSPGAAALLALKSGASHCVMVESCLNASRLNEVVAARNGLQARVSCHFRRNLRRELSSLCESGLK